MTSRASVLLVAALVAWIITALDANAAPVLCKKKKGTVVVRDPACTAKETQIDLAELLGKVPSAATADSLTAPEGWHEVGSDGEPPFQNSWHNVTNAVPLPFSYETAAFYKDHEGLVHLRGAVVGGSKATAIFQLPPGYRPAPAKVLSLATTCIACSHPDPQGETVGVSTGELTIFGSDIDPAIDGAVAIQDTLTGSGVVSLDGITFRAGS
jgi:hypothetical protein